MINVNFLTFQKTLVADKFLPREAGTPLEADPISRRRHMTGNKGKTT
jgi:hypothetical protein